MTTGAGWPRAAGGLLLLALMGVWLVWPAAGRAAAPAPAGVEAPAPSAETHGGGGFALLLLDYRMMLEGFTQDLRGRSAELVDGAQLMPAEMARA